MPCIARSLISLTLSMALVSGQILPAFAVTDLSRAAYEDCQARDEDSFKSIIIEISANALRTGISKIDYPALVADQWRKSGLDDVIDKRVDLAIEEVKHETSWGELIRSLGNTEISQKLATTVAERVYRSDAVKAAMETLATGVAKDVGQNFELASQDAATPVLDCLKAFVGPRYGQAMAQAVAGDAGKDLSVNPDKGGAEISSADIIKQSGGSIAGATILVVRRQLANLATRIGQRIVGSVLSRLVSVVAGGVGLVLIAKDIWEFRNGVLPIIATEMKAKTTKDKVQEELATTIHDQINEHVKEIASASADHVLEIWQSFKRAHAVVLKLAESHGDFRTFLDSVKPGNLTRLDEIVGLLVPEAGESGVLNRLNDGTLNEAVHTMPAKGLDIARETRSVATALAWTKVAGDQLDAVVENEIYRRAKPEDFTHASLARVLALGERTAISRLASVSRDAREILFSVETNDLKVLTKSLSDSELTALAGYIKGLEKAPREQVLKAVAQRPTKMQILSSERVRGAILSSADQTAAVTMMLEDSGAFSPKAFAADLTRAWQGRIMPLLIWDKYPAGVAGIALFAIMLLMWLRRLFRPRPAQKAQTPVA